MAEPAKTIVVGDAVQAGVADFGEFCSLDIREPPSGETVRLVFQTSELGVFMARVLRMGTMAHQIRSKHRIERGQDPDPEPPVSLPVVGVQTRPHTAARGVLLELHLAEGVSLPIHLTLEQSRQLGESLLRQAQALEGLRGMQPH